MKRIVFLAMLALGVLTACDNESGGGDDMIWDLVPVTFNIYLSDSEGQDLLDSTYQDNLIKDKSPSICLTISKYAWLIKTVSNGIMVNQIKTQYFT